MPPDAVARAAWVSPGGYTRTWVAVPCEEHGGIPGSVTISDENPLAPGANVTGVIPTPMVRWAGTPIWLPPAARNDTPG